MNSKPMRVKEWIVEELTVHGPLTFEELYCLVPSDIRALPEFDDLYLLNAVWELVGEDGKIHLDNGKFVAGPAVFLD